VINNKITIQKALDIANRLFVDLRSPLEYTEAHIPGAVNVPLLENEERAIVGTIYKRQSSQLAVDKGLDIVAPKLPHIYNAIKEHSHNRKIILYCWRGGMRSNSISKILTILKVEHLLLEGGYKAFRTYVNDYFNNEFNKTIIVLHGLTGVGKTEILQELKKKGLPAIDLEELANHRGSVFGAIGMNYRPSQKEFEGHLLMECLKYKKFPKIVVECKSQRIGFAMIPVAFFQAMKKNKGVLIYDSIENRVERLVNIYVDKNGCENDESIVDALNILRKHMGNRKINDLLEILKERKYNDIVCCLLKDYYDPLYKYPDDASEEYCLCLDNRNKENTVVMLEKLLITE